MKRAAKDITVRTKMWQMWRADANTIYDDTWEKIYSGHLQPEQEDAAKCLLFLLFALTRGNAWE